MIASEYGHLNVIQYLIENGTYNQNTQITSSTLTSESIENTNDM